ncbi:hypothetical protein EVAR_6409_1 [Eumeta japonica]|uniref:Uncharacterized protein n=1 Tax=Eumeta variegata TaxID=151549 RepID=A0A4C1TFP5_EUMVA|nr:hypothetical protein EVAR_6409_1 [Eumeta japonica]
MERRWRRGKGVTFGSEDAGLVPDQGQFGRRLFNLSQVRPLTPSLVGHAKTSVPDAVVMFWRWLLVNVTPILRRVVFCVGQNKCEEPRLSLRFAPLCPPWAKSSARPWFLDAHCRYQSPPPHQSHQFPTRTGLIRIERSARSVAIGAGGKSTYRTPTILGCREVPPTPVEWGMLETSDHEVGGHGVAETEAVVVVTLGANLNFIMTRLKNVIRFMSAPNVDCIVEIESCFASNRFWCPKERGSEFHCCPTNKTQRHDDVPLSAGN